MVNNTINVNLYLLILKFSYDIIIEVMKMFAVVFDMDGTLLDSQKICIPAWDYAGELQGLENMGRYIEEVCGMNEEGGSNYIKERNPQINTAKFNKDVREYVHKYRVLKLKQGAQEILDFLKENNIKMAVASGTSTASVERNLKEVGVYEYFDAIVGGDKVEKGKPAPDTFLHAAEEIGADPKDCFAFEDSVNGIKSANAAGMRVFGIFDVAKFTEEAKKMMFKELDSFIPAIEILKDYI